jgi:hypothetical protein
MRHGKYGKKVERAKEISGVLFRGGRRFSCEKIKNIFLTL